MKHEVLLRFVTSFLLMATIHGCSQQSQQVVNSPCATLTTNAQIKPSTNLSLMFGNDAIQAAIAAVAGSLIKQPDSSTPSLTTSGTEAALGTAKANGKNPTASDITALETYLRENAIPTVKQNPTCNFVIAPPARPYVGIEKLFLRKIGDKKFPMIGIANTGPAEANAHIVIHQLLDDREHSNVSTDTIIGPGQRRTISLPDDKLPISDIDSGKTALTIIVDISYPLESEATPILHREAWRYDHAANEFYSVPLK